MSAALASGLWGVQNQVTATEPVIGNAYETLSKEHPALPTNISSSSQAFRNSEIAPLYFDKSFINDYATSREWEALNYQKAITDWQLARYFELA